METTLNDVRKAIMMKIASFKDDDTEIYGEQIPQNAIEPYFFIKTIRTSQNRLLGNRYNRRQLYDIRYFPKTSNLANREILTVAEKLYDHMEYIEVNRNLVRGQEMRHEVVDGILHFFVNYPFHVFRQIPEIPKMENLYQERGLKTDG